MGALGVTDAELGRRIGETRQNIHKKKTGQSSITVDNIDDYAAALGIDPDVLMRQPSAALAWLVDHRADELDGQALGKTERANSAGDQAEPRTITHRRNGFPCRRLLVGGSKHSVRCPPDPSHPTSLIRR